MTRDATCREPEEQDSREFRWQTSSISSRRCLCSHGFLSSANRLECERIQAASQDEIDRHNFAAGGENVTNSGSQSVRLSASGSMDSKHQYELVVTQAAQTQDSLEPQSATKTQLNTAGKAPEIQLASSSAAPITTTLIRASSLGKPCRSRLDCQAKDINSDCVNGICECIVASPRCSSNSTGCHKDTFQCRSGHCISWYFVCDQFKNCDDGSDEEFCFSQLASLGASSGPNRPMGSSLNPSGSNLPDCPAEAFKCLDGSGCLSRSKLCNGKRECGDGSDEFACSSTTASTNNSAGSDLGAWHTSGKCPSGTFECANGQCLPNFVFCNAVDDCADGSDEREEICERPTYLARKKVELESQSLMKASNESARSHLGTTSSLLRSDEMIRVQSGEMQNSQLVKADRLVIDRMMAKLRRVPPSTVVNSKRQRSGRPLIRHTRSSFSQFEGEFECPRWAFQCRNGRCRSSAILCSGLDGCGDNSDEDRCEVCRCPDPASLIVRSKPSG